MFRSNYIYLGRESEMKSSQYSLEKRIGLLSTITNTYVLGFRSILIGIGLCFRQGRERDLLEFRVGGRA